MSKYLILIISMLIDGLIPNITNYTLNNLTYFTPLCTVTSLVFLIKPNKNDKKLLPITILLYSALYINNLLLSIVLFIPIYYLIKFIKNIVSDNLLTVLIQAIITILVYEAILFITYSVIVNRTFILHNYWYKVTHSLLLNLIYALVLYFYKRSSKKFT